jgi:hypothetical protein
MQLTENQRVLGTPIEDPPSGRSSWILKRFLGTPYFSINYFGKSTKFFKILTHKQNRKKLMLKNALIGPRANFRKNFNPLFTYDATMKKTNV